MVQGSYPSHSHARTHALSVCRQHFNLSCEQTHSLTHAHTCACTLALTLRHTLTHSHTCSVVRRRRRRWPTCNLSGFGGHSIAWLLLHTLRHRTDWGISTLTCRVAGAVEKPPRMGKGNVLFQLRFAEMQLKTCNLFDVSVFLYEFIMLGTSTPAWLRLLPFFTSSSSFRHLCHCLLSVFTLPLCVPAVTVDLQCKRVAQVDAMQYDPQ